MNIQSAFPSSYIKASDLQGKSVSILMDRVVMEEIGGDHKPVLYFIGKDRGLVLNKTNSSIIAEMHGWETENWNNRKITIYPARVEFQGKIVDAIRVKLETVSHHQAPPAPMPQQRPTANGRLDAPIAAQDSVTTGFDEEIPF